MIRTVSFSAIISAGDSRSGGLFLGYVIWLDHMSIGAIFAAISQIGSNGVADCPQADLEDVEAGLRSSQ